MRVLILGGTTEASHVATLLAGDARFAPVLSLAGRTRVPQRPPIPCRVGGFGGAEGLARWLAAESIAALVDATHPFAAQISANAVAAARACRIPLLSIVRPPWTTAEGDRWIAAPDMDAAAAALGEAPRRVFLAIGRLGLAAFRKAPQHRYLVRAIDPPDADSLPPEAEVVLARGPFDEESETALMQAHGIEILVAKNSGGGAAWPKIAAARRLGLPVVMVARPAKPAGTVVPDAPQALRWLEGLLAVHHGTVSDRGV